MAQRRALRRTETGGSRSLDELKGTGIGLGEVETCAHDHGPDEADAERLQGSEREARFLPAPDPHRTLPPRREAVTGRNLEEVLRERIYEPLGTHDTNNFEATADHGRMAKVYPGSDAQVGWAPGDDPSFPIVRASGGMISTALDYAILMQTWLDGGRFGNLQLLSGESVALGTSVQSPTGSYGFGWSVSSDGHFSHGGSDGTFAWADPQRELIGIVFAQHPGADNPTGQFRELVNQALVDFPPG